MAIIPLSDMSVEEILTYEEVLIEILDRKFKRLRNKELHPSRSYEGTKELKSATWEAEADITKQYPYLFPSISA